MTGSKVDFRGTFEERIDKRVERTAGCWNWTGGLKDGYGVVAPPRAHLAPVSMLRVHRVMYERLVGPIPKGLTLDHLCRNRACVRPDHLEPVTRGENVRRGNAPGLVAARTGICMKGHARTPENTYATRTTGARQCAVCATNTRHAREARGSGL